MKGFSTYGLFNSSYNHLSTNRQNPEKGLKLKHLPVMIDAPLQANWTESI